MAGSGMRQVFTLFLAGFSAFLTVACARTAHEMTVPVEETVSAPTPVAAAVMTGAAFRETGTASWHGRELHGRSTASCSVFDMNGISAAHRTLPLGTVVHITNLDNFKSITAMVTDRGPFFKNHVIDLSYGAARELGFVELGTAQVRIETEGPLPAGGTWTVLAATFAEEENAKVLKYRLSQRYEVVSIQSFTNNIGTFYRVRVGNYPSEEKAERIAAKLTLEGLEPLVLRKD